jgi:hypothetical protein
VSFSAVRVKVGYGPMAQEKTSLFRIRLHSAADSGSVLLTVLM